MSSSTNLIARGTFHLSPALNLANVTMLEAPSSEAGHMTALDRIACTFVMALANRGRPHMTEPARVR
jgi:hypothetical protein